MTNDANFLFFLAWLLSALCAIVVLLLLLEIHQGRKLEHRIAELEDRLRSREAERNHLSNGVKR